MVDEHILIVDDDREVRDLITGMLQSFGHTCMSASHADEALALVRDHHFDMIISDVRMPGMNGITLIQEVHHLIADIPFIVITGYSEDYSYDRVIKAGANDFIRKPFTSQELKNKLNRIFKERSLARENEELLQKHKSIQKKLEHLLKVALDLTAELDFERLVALIVGHVTKTMEAQRTSLYFIDRDRNEIWTKVAEQVDQIRLPIGKGISGRVAETGETINVDDVATLPYFDRAFDIKHNFTTKSVLCMPICNRTGARVAVIQVMNKMGEHGFTQEDIDLLTVLSSQIAIALENSQLMEEVSLSFESSVRTLSATVDARHRLTAGHSQRVTEYSLMIARQLGLDEEDQKVIRYAGLLHDIGKIGIRDEVLLKFGQFTPQEREEMKQHTVKTQSILENFHFPKLLQDVPFIAAHHHEKINGEGYPDGLKGDEIPLASRILAVSDVFDALTSSRDYPKYTRDETLDCEPMPLAKAIDILKQDAGTHFDSDVVAAFIVCLPRALLQYRGTHFRPDYVDEIIRTLGGC